MRGFLALARKEALEQLRTRRFLGFVGIFTLVAVLGSVVPFIVTEVKNGPQGVSEARENLAGFGRAVTFLGTFLVIVVTMGTLAGERGSGTAAMTLSKPVSRSAFVAAKFMGLVLSVFAALAIASTVDYVLNLAFFADGGLARFAVTMVILGAYLVFIGSIAFFCSSMFTTGLAAGGMAFLLIILQTMLLPIPHTARYVPIVTPEYALRYVLNSTSDLWPAFAVACGSIVLLSTGAWAVFRRKEL